MESVNGINYFPKRNFPEIYKCHKKIWIGQRIAGLTRWDNKNNGNFTYSFFIMYYLFLWMSNPLNFVISKQLRSSQQFIIPFLHGEKWYTLFVQMSRLMRNIIFRGYEALFSENCCTILGHLMYRKKVKLRYKVKEALFLINVYSEKG